MNTLKACQGIGKANLRIMALLALFTLSGCVCTPVVLYSIGDVGPGGGIVFHVTDGGLHGLEAAHVDQSAGMKWCEELYTDVVGVLNLGTSVPADPNSGAHNTAHIVADCGRPASAAAEAAAYTWPNGQTDGFLPNREELDLLYNQKALVGGFADALYWGSSEIEIDLASVQFFTDGDKGAGFKDSTYRVRAVRAF